MKELSIYLFLGMMWTIYLRYITTNFTEGEYSSEWSTLEKVVHTLLWPLFFTVFIYEFIKGGFKKK